MDSTQRLELLAVLDHVLSYSSKAKPSIRRKPFVKKSVNSSDFEDRESHRENKLKVHKVRRNKIDESLLPRNENAIGNGMIECEDSTMDLLDILAAGKTAKKRQDEKLSEPRHAKARKDSEFLGDQMIKRTQSYNSTSICSDLETSFQSPIPETCFKRLRGDLKGEVAEENWENLLQENSEEFLQACKWTSNLDETLLELAYEFDCDWKKVAKHFPEQNISIKSLKDRYKILKDVSLPNKARFTPQEDRKILRYYKKYGMNWAAISSMLPGRGAITVKNRFYSSLRYKLEKESAVSEEHLSIPEKTTTAAEPSLSLSKTCSTSMNIEEEELETKVEQDEGEKNSFLEIGHIHKSYEYDCDHFFSFQDLKQGEDFEVDTNLDRFKIFENNNSNDFINYGSEIPEVIQQQEHPATVQGLNNKINLLMSLYSQICQDLNSTKNHVNNKVY